MKNSNGSAIHPAVILGATSCDITKAFAWIRDQRDERDERLDQQGADRTALCLRSADGVFRAPLAVLIERGESTEPVEPDDESTAESDDGIDDDACFCPHEPDDAYAQLADVLGIKDEDPVNDRGEEPKRPETVFVTNNPATRRAIVSYL